MATVIGVRFKKAGKVYYFDPSGIWPRPGDCVIVETARGVEFGEVVTGARTVSDQQIVTPLKKVIKEIMAPLIAMIIVLIIITYVPDVVLFLPRLLMHYTG